GRGRRRRHACHSRGRRHFLGHDHAGSGRPCRDPLAGSHHRRHFPGAGGADAAAEDAMTALDWLALALFGAGVCGSARIARLAGRERNLKSMLHGERRGWMQRMMTPSDRVLASALTGHTVHSMAFFSSATILLIAGMTGVM